MSRPCTFGPADQVSHAAEISAAFDWGEELEPFHGKFPKGYQSHDLVQNHAFEVIGYDASIESFTCIYRGSISEDPTTFTMSAHELAKGSCYIAVARGCASGEKAPARDMAASLARPMAASHGPAAHLL